MFGRKRNGYPFHVLRPHINAVLLGVWYNRGMYRDRDTNATQRIARVVWQLAHGRALTTRQVAELAEVSTAGAWAMLARLSSVLPVYQDAEGRWCIVDGCPANDAKHPSEPTTADARTYAMPTH